MPQPVRVQRGPAVFGALVAVAAGCAGPVDGLVLEVACGTGQEMLRCGATSIEHAADWLALLPGPAGIRLAYSTGQDGTWIAPISVTPC